jgi:hypothetical protein
VAGHGRPGLRGHLHGRNAAGDGLC